jgi:2-haloacid dehalogenase
MHDGAVLTASVDNRDAILNRYDRTHYPQSRPVRSAYGPARFGLVVECRGWLGREGRAWRAEYLRLTYGCGAYRPYEQLVREAADATAIEDSATEALVSRWGELSPWSGAQTLLDKLQNVTKLAVVTNCSERLGVLAASRLGTRWDCIVTAERAGYYKPHPRPYLLALETLGASARDSVFVAGSGYDLIGTSGLGVRSYWHNRYGLQRPAGAPPLDCEWSTLDHVLPWLRGDLP